MNNPIILSTPASSGGRPDTTLPNTTSGSLLYRLSSSPHPPCTKVFNVIRCLCPNSSRACVVLCDRRTTLLRCTGGPDSCPAPLHSTTSFVGVLNPRKFCRQ